MPIVKRANRRFRRGLVNRIRNRRLDPRDANLKPRIVGAKGNWGIGILRGSSVFLIKTGFPTTTAANIYSMMRYGIKAPVGAGLIPS